MMQRIRILAPTHDEQQMQCTLTIGETTSLLGLGTMLALDRLAAKLLERWRGI